MWGHRESCLRDMLQFILCSIPWIVKNQWWIWHSGASLHWIVRSSASIVKCTAAGVQFSLPSLLSWAQFTVFSAPLPPAPAQLVSSLIGSVPGGNFTWRLSPAQFSPQLVFSLMGSVLLVAADHTNILSKVLAKMTMHCIVKLFLTLGWQTCWRPRSLFLSQYTP